MQDTYDRKHPYPIVLIRRAEDDHRIDAVVAMLRRCAQLDPPVAFTRHRGADMTWAIEEISEDWLRRTYGGLEEAADRRSGLLALMTAHDEPVKLVYQRQLKWLPFRYEIVTIDVPWAPRRADRPVLRTRAQLFTLLREAAVAFDADIGALYPRSLHALVRLASGARAKASRESGDDNGGSTRPGSGVPPFVAGLPEGLFERFATLEPPRGFDVAAVPESVWWGNVWSRRVVERLGRARVEALPWSTIEPAGDGGLFLVSTATRPAPNKPAALEHIAALNEGLDLPRLQRAAGPA